MTTELRPDQRDWAGNDFGSSRAAQATPPGTSRRPPGSHARRRQPLFARYPAWPLVALLAGFPLWWALGIADYMFIVAAIPMAGRLLAWQGSGRRPVRLPPGFSIWLLFLVCMLAGITTLTLTAPHTVHSPVSSRLLSFGDRGASYLAVTVLLLFAGNLTERELPRRQLAWLLGLVGIYATIGGIGGILFPHFSFTSPEALVMPASFQHNTLVQATIHPGLAQVQGVLGVAEGRPKAPFDYTDAWGECLTICLPWLLVAWSQTARQRRWALLIAGIALVPLVFSLDRGAWIGTGVGVLYLAFRFAARGRLGMLGAVCAGLAVAGVIILLTPLHGLISGRLTSDQNSNGIRSTLNSLAVKDATASPLIGYGDERHEQGSRSSIAVGPTAKCYACGQQEVGSTGQLWLLLVSDGFVGAGLYLGFFAYGIWRYRRDRSPYGLAGVLVLLLNFVYMFTYEAVVAPLAFTMLAYALLWRNDRQSHISARQPTGLPASTAPADAAPAAGARPAAGVRSARGAVPRALA